MQSDFSFLFKTAASPSMEKEEKRRISRILGVLSASVKASLDLTQYS
jgi:hypothetical protein